MLIKNLIASTNSTALFLHYFNARKYRTYLQRIRRKLINVTSCFVLDHSTRSPKWLSYTGSNNNRTDCRKLNALSELSPYPIVPLTYKLHINVQNVRESKRNLN
jgi:hypothetical protein